MSRSYKRYPHDTSTVGYFKRYSNKRNRQRQREMIHEYELGNTVDAESMEFDDGGDFKKNGETYNIRDWVFVVYDKSVPYYMNAKKWYKELNRMLRK